MKIRRGACRVEPGLATEVWLTIPNVMRAAVGLAGKKVLFPITVAIFGPREAGAGKDAWGTSEYLVFRRVSPSCGGVVLAVACADS